MNVMPQMLRSIVNRYINEPSAGKLNNIYYWYNGEPVCWTERMRGGKLKLRFELPFDLSREFQQLARQEIGAKVSLKLKVKNSNYVFLSGLRIYSNNENELINIADIYHQLIMRELNEQKMPYTALSEIDLEIEHQ